MKFTTAIKIRRALEDMTQDDIKNNRYPVVLDSLSREKRTCYGTNADGSFMISSIKDNDIVYFTEQEVNDKLIYPIPASTSDNIKKVIKEDNQSIKPEGILSVRYNKDHQLHITYYGMVNGYHVTDSTYNSGVCNWTEEEFNANFTYPIPMEEPKPKYSDTLEVGQVFESVLGNKKYTRLITAIDNKKVWYAFKDTTIGGVATAKVEDLDNGHWELIESPEPKTLANTPAKIGMKVRYHFDNVVSDKVFEVSHVALLRPNNSEEEATDLAGWHIEE